MTIPSNIGRLFGFGGRRSEQPPPSRLLPPAQTAGVYVDIENLRNAEHARTVVEAIIHDWPDTLPSVGCLCFYVPADKTGLWRAWARTRFPALDIRVRGIQHFTRQSSKNSADMAIVADAIADFITGAVNHIAVVSNDSDFGALFIKIHELTSGANQTVTPPFLWVHLPGVSGVSKEFQDFIPEQLRWVLPSPPQPNAKSSPIPATTKGAELPPDQTVVRWLLKEIPSGRFRAEQVRKIIARHCPAHPAAQTTGVCGAFLSRQLMPLLAKEGVKIVRKAPRTYEMGG